MRDDISDGKSTMDVQKYKIQKPWENMYNKKKLIIKRPTFSCYTNFPKVFVFCTFKVWFLCLMAYQPSYPI